LHTYSLLLFHKDNQHLSDKINMKNLLAYLFENLNAENGKC